MRDIPLDKIKGIGPARKQALMNAGIDTVRAFVAYLPEKYVFLDEITPIGSLEEGGTYTVRGRITGPVREKRPPRLVITQIRITDDTGNIDAVWFNQPWLKKQLEGKEELLLHGSAVKRGNKLLLQSPTFETGEEKIRPVYHALNGIPSKAVAACMRSALEVAEGQWPDELPVTLRKRYDLCERNFAMRQAHIPDSREALDSARYRLAFEELLLFQCGIMLLRSGYGDGIQIPCTEEDGKAFWSSLAFRPTAAQIKVFGEIIKDLSSPSPMARLVQGDVGSGKTAIAFASMFIAVKHGWQCAMMAPTEILAHQHYESAKTMFEPLGISCGLLTGGMGVKERRTAKERIAAGEIQVVIGTHALISSDIVYKDLGLVITDEQHRFGVEQRTELQNKGKRPNVLVMSATPIPRTLSLILYGDLDISVVNELPGGRIPVKTRIVPEEKRERLYGFLLKEIEKGRQIYIVCPVVDPSEEEDAKNAEETYKYLSEGPLRHVRVGLAHGRMKSAEKDAVLDAFKRGEIDVLVATTVIEVGVNVPNATVMVIENADRYGLSQLHQLRGRVGRGSEESWCFFLGEPNEKLKILTETNDGFIIAEKDLQMRGPGELLGIRQSGILTPGKSVIASDTNLLKLTHDIARQYCRDPSDPEASAVLSAASEILEEKLKHIGMN
ncbi:MAG: ATP-dependent DNA helicase RecG [Clostridiales bacterium]|nr:ATP-dependent DNA helicase RecG [Clostridiales bacterium]